MYVSVHQTWKLNCNKPSRGKQAPPGHERTVIAVPVVQPRAFSQTMQMARIRQGMSIGRLATATGLPADRLAAFERNEETPSDEIVELVMGALRGDDDREAVTCDIPT